MQSMAESFRIAHLPPYLLGNVQQEVVGLRAQGREIIDLSHLNPDMGPPPRAVDRLVQAVLQPHNHRYSSSRGISQLRAAAVEWYKKRFDGDFDLEREVVVTMGTKEGMAHLLLAILNAGENVVVPTPSYPIHASSVFIAGGGFIGVPLFSAEEYTDIYNSPRGSLSLNEASDGFFSRLESICLHTWPKPKVFICSFPHNPTTTVVSQGFFQRLVEFAREHQLLLIHDAAYCDLSYSEHQAPSLLEIKGARDLAVEFFSLSKSFGLPGWRVGFAIGNQAMISALKKIKSYVDNGIFQPLQIASIEALKDADRLVDEVRSNYLSRRDVLVDGLRQAGWDVHKPKGTVFVWARLPAAFRAKGRTMGSAALARLLLHEGNPGVAVTPGAYFDPQADEFVRFALVENENRLRRAVGSIGEVLRHHVG